VTDGTNTMTGILLAANSEVPDATAAVILGQKPVTYRTLTERSAGVADLVNQESPNGAAVAVMGPNSLGWLYAMYGVILSGRTAVLLNPLLTPTEVEYQIEQSNVDLVLASTTIAPEVRKHLSQRSRIPVKWWDDTFEADSYGTGDPGRYANAVETDDRALIIYTSGTTSMPKGVELTHGAICKNAEAVSARFHASSNDKVFGAGPFFHSGGITMHVVLSALNRATLLSVPKFEASRVLQMVEDEGATIYSGIETLFLRLLSAPGFTRERMRSVRTGWTTGTPSTVDLIAEQVGIPGIICVYGITEAGPNVLMSDLSDAPHLRRHTIGRPQSNTEVRIVDLVNGTDVQDDVPGELLVRGASLMRGYYNKPEETAAALTGGWLHTGDILLRRKDGYFEFGGRSKDIVRTGGENVSCAEVEDAIYATGAVALAAVVGMSDDTYGEIVVAVVVPKEGEQIAIDALNKSLRKTLSGYKVPKRILVRENLPMTATGKIRKPDIKDLLANLNEHGDGERSRL
jgi:fatty-acyl-CoA synthase